MPQFTRLNQGWNAEPNAPEPTAHADGTDVVLRFYVNHFIYPGFREDDLGILRFIDCERYRLGDTNDEGWYKGRCRYSGVAPEWGEFYELSGDDPACLAPTDWILIPGNRANKRHFLFYFRDETFECLASAWRPEPSPENALSREKVLG
jgi:hypothetical protein